MDLNDDQSNNFCFLVPMEVVFEDFIAGFIEAHFPQWKASKQAPDYLATTDGRPIFQIRNDLYFPNRLIVDTKYKTLQPTDDKFGISQADMYQMVAYAIKRNCFRVMMLYPQTGENPFAKSFEVVSKELKLNIHIDVNTIDIVNSELQKAIEFVKQQIQSLLGPSVD